MEPVDPSKTADCANGDFFELEYAAHVPIGDPSNFGGVPYTLFLTGMVGIIDGTFKSSAGTTVDSQDRMSADDTGVVDGEVIIQCAGGCIDYSISGVPVGGQVKLAGSLISGTPGDINVVATGLGTCLGSTAPLSCTTGNTGGFTFATISPISILAGQQVQIEVTLSFS